MYYIKVVDDQNTKMDEFAAETLSDAEREAATFAGSYINELFDIGGLFTKQIMFVQIYDEQTFVKAVKIEVVE